VLQYCVLLQWCTKIWAVLTGRLTVSGFDLAWFSSLSSKRLCVFGLNGAIYSFFCLHRSLYLLVSWAWWDWPLTWLTNHGPSVLWHCWLGHVTRKTVSEMTCNVSSGTLNSTILSLSQLSVCHCCINLSRCRRQLVDMYQAMSSECCNDVCRIKTAKRRHLCLWWPSVKFLMTGTTKVLVGRFTANYIICNMPNFAAVIMLYYCIMIYMSCDS